MRTSFCWKPAFLNKYVCVCVCVCVCVGGGSLFVVECFLKSLFSNVFFFRFCPLFPFQSIKTVRLRLNLTRQFIEDQRLDDSWSSQKAVYLYYIIYSLCLHSFFPESKCSLMWYFPLFSLNVRVLLLVRDPRGTIQSRKHRWQQLFDY